MGRGAPTVSDVQLDYVVPSPDMAEFVTLFYHFRADVPIFEDTERADNAQLRIRLSPGEGSYVFPDGSVQPAGDMHLVGPTSGAVKVRVDGPLRVFGMGLTAAGWAAIVGNDASSMLNRVIDAAELFGAAILRDAQKALAEAASLQEIGAIGEALVSGLIKDNDRGALLFVRHVDAWLAHSSSPEVDELACATGLSRRQVERRCNMLYGAPPKLLARKYRALRAAVALATEDEALDEIIARGFYDQSHLIREIKQFTGLTPRQIKAEPTLLAKLTIEQRHALGGQVSSLISDT
jgi:AraC-like DNA-binding protein